MNKITIYSKDNCSYCDQAIRTAQQLNSFQGTEYIVLKLNEDYTTDEFSIIFPSANTYPQIIVDNQKIGGWNEFRSMF